MTEIKEGDTVCLRAEQANTFLDPKLRLRAARGIPGRVVCVFGNSSRFYRVEFAAVGRLKAVSEIFSVWDLELVP